MLLGSEGNSQGWGAGNGFGACAGTGNGESGKIP
jgi:hypothetical protein